MKPSGRRIQEVKQRPMLEDHDHNKEYEAPEHHERHKVSLGKEIFDRFDPTSSHEDVLPSKKGMLIAVLILVAFFWTLYAGMAVFYFNVLDEGKRTVDLLLLTLPPIIFIAAFYIALCWYLAGEFAKWNSWGRANPLFAKLYWLTGLVLLSLVYFDPVNRLHDMMSNLPLIGNINSGALALRLVIALMAVSLIWDNLVHAVSRGWYWVSRWHWQITSIFLGMKITGVHFARTKITELYPEERVDLSPIFRGRHFLAFDEHGEHLCISCKACEKICPDRLIAIESVRNPETRKLVLTGFILDNSRCSFCGLCEDVCPTGAIRHSSEYAYSSPTRDGLVLDILGDYIEKTKTLRSESGEDK